MKKTVRFLSLVIAAVLCLSVFAVCPFSLTAHAEENHSFGKVYFTSSGASTNIDFEYAGKAAKPYITVENENGDVLTNKVDYKLVYSNNECCCYSANVKVIGIGDYADCRSKTLYFNIVPPKPKNLKIVESHVEDTCTFTWTVNPVVESYYVVCGGSTAIANNGSYTVSGLQGKSLEFKVHAMNKGYRKGYKYGSGDLRTCYSEWSTVTLVGMKSCSISTQSKSYAYTGEKLRPILTVSQEDGGGNTNVYKNHEDYTLKYKNNVDIGTATVTVTGKGKYFYGQSAYNFDIVPKKVSNLKITGHTDTEATLTWNASDYAQKYYIYSNSEKIGETTDTTFTVTGLDGYTKEFKVCAVADGKNKSGVTVDYLSDPKSVTLIGMKSVSPSVKYSYYSYTGSAIRPLVSVWSRDTQETLTNHTDYSVKYIDNVKCGQASVRIRGLGKYRYGEATVPLFSIRPASIPGFPSVSNVTSSSAKISWQAAEFADKYIVEFKNGKTIRTTKTTCTLSKLTSGQYYSVSITPVILETTGSGEVIEHTGKKATASFTAL